ncbi:MAG: 4-hydroxy-tetrahydrodipicolinate reductase [Chitinophagaceae bacterium]|nr:4-hydroxy-tetrahydrodipicolinate reductase [Chitinophagaceae bacterium]
MKLALIGYGKMGKAIEEIALEKGHDIVLKISSNNLHDFTEENIRKADVCIEFTTPHTAFSNIQTCLHAGVPVVCGSTGWLEKKKAIEQIALEKDLGFLYASNFSVGVNLFFYINEQVAALMSKYPQYQVSVEEIHHTAKKDAPSGTAVTIAEGILMHRSDKTNWINEATTSVNELAIISKRIDPAPGTHTVFYQSAIDDIVLNHTAHNRKGFASGAVLAAEFLKGKSGIFGMREVLGIGEK